MLLSSCYSYSEEVFGVSSNAASFGRQWVMRNILPQQAGLAVNSVFYRYRTVKNTEDEMSVTIQNENARGSGYIFREVDNWSGLPSNTITKTVPVPLIDISYWGMGSIEVDGFGSVEDAEVFYSYQFDPCFDPQSDPTCDGYIDPNVKVILDGAFVDPLSDEFIQAELDRKAQMRSAKEEQERRERRKISAEAQDNEEERLEDLLGLRSADDFSAEQIRLHNTLRGLQGLPNSYMWSYSGGEYRDAIVLKDSKLPRNSRGLKVRLAQEIKHQQLINLQYAKKK